MDWSGYQYSNSITIKGRIGNFITGLPHVHWLFPWFHEIPQEPPPDRQFKVNLNGGTGDVFTAAVDTYFQSAGSYLQSTTVAPGDTFAYSVEPDEFHELVAVTWSYDGALRFTTDTVAPEVTGYSHYTEQEIVYTAELVPKVRLLVEIEGEGVVTGNGFAPSYHPRILTLQNYIYPGAYAAYAQPLVDSNQVIMMAEPCKGWRFKHWVVDTGNGEPVPLEGGPTLPVFMNWWTGTGIRLDEDATIMSVKAVFVEDPVKVILLSGFQWFQHLAPADRDMLLADPSVDTSDSGMEQLLQKIPASNGSGCFGYHEALYLNESNVLISGGLWDISSDERGRGPVFDMVVNNVLSGQIRRFAFIGYSRGGGSVADLCHRLTNPKPARQVAFFAPGSPPSITYWNRPADPHFNVPFPLQIAFTGYIDAISQSSVFSTGPEPRRPATSAFHANLYQTVGTCFGGPPPFAPCIFLSGSASNPPASPNHDINTVCATMFDLDHFKIATCHNTHDAILNAMDHAVHSWPLVPFEQDACTPPCTPY